MNILHWISEDEYKQKVISKILVEAALLQFILSFLMIVVYLFTDMDPLFLYWLQHSIQLYCGFFQPYFKYITYDTIQK